MENLFSDALHQLLTGRCTLATVRQVEAGGSPAALWKDIEESGLSDAMLGEAHGGAGLNLADAFALLELCGAHAVPVPLAETMVARAVLDNAGLTPPKGSITFGQAMVDAGGNLACAAVPCGRVADWVLVAQGDRRLLLPVAKAPASTQRGGSSFELPFTVFNWNQVLGAVLALAGGLVLVYRRQIHVLNAGYRTTVTGATAVLLAGAVLAFGVGTHSTAADPTAGNPVKPTQDSIARGKLLFQQNCVQCHGIDGRGDGPQAAQLSPAPSDFRQHMPLHTDPQFYAFIHDGYAGTAMPAFGSAFSPTDIWNLVNFLRDAFTQRPSQ